MMDFSQALSELKRGHQVTRHVWGFAKPRIALQRPDEGSKMMLPYLYIEAPRGKGFVPWQPGQEDLLAEDWVLVK